MRKANLPEKASIEKNKQPGSDGNEFFEDEVEEMCLDF